MEEMNGVGALDIAGMNFWKMIEQRAAATPEYQMAFDEQGRTLSFAAYHEQCLRVAGGLAALGVGEETRVSWVLPSRFESLILAGALARLGAVQNPILPIYRHREISFIIEQFESEFLIVPGVFRGFDYAAMADELVATRGGQTVVVVADPDLPEADPDDLADFKPTGEQDLRWVFYSSGTTADPKGAKHSDHSMAAANAGMQWSMEVTSSDRAAVVFPITHVGGMVWLFNVMQTGAQLLMVEVFDPRATPRWLGEHGCTCAGAGTVFWLAYLALQRELGDSESILPDVRIFNGGGAPKPVGLHEEIMEIFGAPVIGGWGLTESPINTMVHIDDPDVKKSSTEGRPCPGVSVRVVLDGVELERGQEGELQVAGPQVCLGYLDASLDAEAFTDDGWFRTGDLGIIDDGGWIRITGRLKDIIIRKGENISAKEIEDLLYQHPAVVDVAVIGLPDVRSGERACAVVVCAPGESLSLEDMTEFLDSSGRLARFKYPEQLVLVDALPRNPSGKVLKRDLRTELGVGAAPTS